VKAEEKKKLRPGKKKNADTKAVSPMPKDSGLPENSVLPEDNNTSAPEKKELAAAEAIAATETKKPSRKERRRDRSSKKKRHIFRYILLSLATLFIGSLVFAFFYLDVPNWQKLDVNKITSIAQTGSIYDAGGNFVSAIQGKENRTVIRLADVPLQVRQAFLAAEDLRFYSHFGVDPVRFFGALVANIKSGSFSEGFSTISQQLIKLSHLSAKKTIARKAEEVYLALQLESRFTKDEIFEMYLNYVYFGNGAYGLQAASQTYFAKDVKDLTVAQAASLAAILNATTTYNPTLHLENNKNRQRYILNTMLENGMIDTATHDAALAEDLQLAESKPIVTAYGWFVDAVLSEAEELLDVSAETLLGSGYRIETTLDPRMQDIADAQYKTDVFPNNASDGTKVQSAMACLDVKTGAVRAVVGGREYTVLRGLNRATQLKRQPGSAIKPLAVYAPALEYYGYTTASVLKDEPTDFNGYKPRNSGDAYYGSVTVRTALQYSLNVSTVSLLQQIGIEAARNYLTKTGIPLDRRDTNLSLALGSLTYGVSPVQLAAAYAPFANQGYYNAPYFIEKIIDNRGQVLYQHQPNPQRVLSVQNAYLMTSLLQSVTSVGTGAKLASAGTPVAGKTGTVNLQGGGTRDIWMAAYNTEITTAVWMGFDNTDSKHRISGTISGGDNTAALSRNFFKAVYQDHTKPQFEKPGGIVSLELDKKSVEWRGEALLAVDITPKAYRFTEVFTAANHPTKRSDIWNPPRTPNSFYITHNENGNPLLVIQPADYAVYRIQRDTVGESFVLTEIWGSAGETLYYADTKAVPGVTYTYRVIPVHAELLLNGIVLEGVQSVQVAQATTPSTGSILNDMFGFLFGSGTQSEPPGSTAPPEIKENTSSIFWK
jgi:1A family penicillin-binding protein